MSNERLWLTLSRGISADISDPVLQREVNAELADDAPLLVTALRKAVRDHLAKAHGRLPLDDGDGEGE